jgi:hypothetical protein
VSSIRDAKADALPKLWLAEDLTCWLSSKLVSVIDLGVFGSKYYWIDYSGMVSGLTLAESILSRAALSYLDPIVC